LTVENYEHVRYYVSDLLLKSQLFVVWTRYLSRGFLEAGELFYETIQRLSYVQEEGHDSYFS